MANICIRRAFSQASMGFYLEDSPVLASIRQYSPVFPINLAFALVSFPPALTLHVDFWFIGWRYLSRVTVPIGSYLDNNCEITVEISLKRILFSCPEKTHRNLRKWLMVNPEGTECEVNGMKGMNENWRWTDWMNPSRTISLSYMNLLLSHNPFQYQKVREIKERKGIGKDVW